MNVFALIFAAKTRKSCLNHRNDYYLVGWLPLCMLGVSQRSQEQLIQLRVPNLVEMDLIIVTEKAIVPSQVRLIDHGPVVRGCYLHQPSRVAVRRAKIFPTWRNDLIDVTLPDQLGHRSTACAPFPEHLGEFAHKGLRSAVSNPNVRPSRAQDEVRIAQDEMYSLANTRCIRAEAS